MKLYIGITISRYLALSTISGDMSISFDILVAFSVCIGIINLPGVVGEALSVILSKTLLPIKCSVSSDVL